MITSILLGLVSGIMIGIITGILPGIHINLVASLLLVYLSTHMLPVECSIAFIAALTITHTMLDFIPSLLLGVPEESNVLALLPSHELIKQGKGYEACILALQGTLAGMIIFCVLAVPFYLVIPLIIAQLTPFIPYVLALLSTYLIFRDQALQSFIIASLAGLLGVITFSLPVKEPLLPLLTGLFGIASLYASIQEKTTIPKQKIPQTSIRLPRKSYQRSILATACISPICSFLPGIGSGHATTFAAEVSTPDRRTFIFMTGITATLVTSLSFITLLAINKARTGSAAFIQNVLPTITGTQIVILICSLLITTLVCIPLYHMFTRKAIVIMNKINYALLTKGTLIFVVIINIVLTNITGLFVLCAGTCIGYCCIQSGVRRITLMACLIIPSIVYYLTN